MLSLRYCHAIDAITLRCPPPQCYDFTLMPPCCQYATLRDAYTLLLFMLRAMPCHYAADVAAADAASLIYSIIRAIDVFSPLLRCFVQSRTPHP